MPDGSYDPTHQCVQAWDDALLAARLIQAGGTRLKGLWLKARAGGVRDLYLDILREGLPSGTPWLRLPVGAGASALYGSIDLAASAHAGRPIATRGLLAAADGGFLIIPMAERLEPATAAMLAMALDGDGHAGPLEYSRTDIRIILVDEGVEDGETPPRAVTDRLPLRIGLDGVPWRVAETAKAAAPHGTLPAARLSADALRLLALLAEAGGESGLHALHHLALIARLHGALCGRDIVDGPDVAAALRLCLGLQVSQPQPREEPQEEAAPPEAPPPQQAAACPQTEAEDPSNPPEMSLRQEELQEWLSAVEAGSADALPALMADKAGHTRGGQTGKAGAMRRNSRRGRPYAVAQSQPYPDARPDLAATLRAAAPWQRIRAAAKGQDATQLGTAPRLHVTSQDFRYLRRRHATPSTAIFLVDASGSTALERLGETKGAIEHLLARCYVRRDEVALIAFRGNAAKLILPPTRSLTLAKRTLAGLPGGGPTPLVSGLDMGLELALSIRRQGGSPLLVLLTDGSGNIARDGSPDRQRARAELHSVAALYRSQQLHSVCIDIARRPREQVAALASDLGADLHVLRQAEAGRMSDLVYTSMHAGAP